MSGGRRITSAQSLKRLWKTLGITGQVKNYSSKPLWVMVTDTGRPVAHLLPPMSKTQKGVDADAIKRVDGKPVEGHSSWWKLFDFSTMEVFDGKEGLRLSVIKKVRVQDSEFTRDKIIYDRSKWGEPIKFIIDVRRGKKRKITHYHVSGLGWLKPAQTLEMTCRGEIDNARPVFPSTGKPYIRTRRDKQLFNNIETMG